MLGYQEATPEKLQEIENDFPEVKNLLIKKQAISIQTTPGVKDSVPGGRAGVCLEQ